MRNVNNRISEMVKSPDTMNNLGGRLGYSPLYLQVKQQLIEKMIKGDWPPGSLLPSEQQLSTQIGVSQGTVRKALDALATENIVVRQQGRGTFVAEHDQNRTLFQFFKLVDENGESKFPETVHARLESVTANATERQAFGLKNNARVWHITRHRALKEAVALLEKIIIPVEKFPKLDSFQPLPNNIYQLYEKQFSKTITRAVEKLRAVSAGTEDADILGCEQGDPILLINRSAYSLDGSLTELRETRCLTEKFQYISDLY